MQSVGRNGVFQHLFTQSHYILTLAILCSLGWKRIRPYDFNFSSILKRSKMAWGETSFYCTSVFLQMWLAYTHVYPWHLAKCFSCPPLSTYIKLWGTKRMHSVLTQRLGTRLDRLTCRGANIWSCWRQDMAAACTSESEWSCVIAHPTKQEERIVEIVAPLPNNFIWYP